MRIIFLLLVLCNAIYAMKEDGSAAGSKPRRNKKSHHRVRRYRDHKGKARAEDACELAAVDDSSSGGGVAAAAAAVLSPGGAVSLPGVTISSEAHSEYIKALRHAKRSAQVRRLTQQVKGLKQQLPALEERVHILELNRDEDAGHLHNALGHISILLANDKVRSGQMAAYRQAFHVQQQNEANAYAKILLNVIRVLGGERHLMLTGESQPDASDHLYGILPDSMDIFNNAAGGAAAAGAASGYRSIPDSIHDDESDYDDIILTGGGPAAAGD